MTVPNIDDDRRFAFENADKLDGEERLQRQPPEALVRLLRALRPARIVDVGVGTGTFAIPAAQALPESRVLGVDVERRMLERFEERAARAGVLDRISTRVMPPDRLELPPDFADAVMLVNVLHELPDRVRYLRSAFKVLRGGGLVLICDWDPEALSQAGPPHEHRVARDRVLSDLREAGFNGELTHPLYADFYTVTARRG